MASDQASQKETHRSTSSIKGSNIKSHSYSVVSGDTWTDFSTESYAAEQRARDDVFAPKEEQEPQSRDKKSPETYSASKQAKGNPKTTSLRDKTWSRLKKTFIRRAASKDESPDDEPPAEPPETYRRRHRSSIAMGSLYELQVRN